MEKDDNKLTTCEFIVMFLVIAIIGFIITLMINKTIDYFTDKKPPTITWTIPDGTTSFTMNEEEIQKWREEYLKTIEEIERLRRFKTPLRCEEGICHSVL